MRKIEFQNDCYYHIYNRGVDKRNIFLDEHDYARFIRSMREFNVLKPIGSLYEKAHPIVSPGSKSPLGFLEPDELGKSDAPGSRNPRGLLEPERQLEPEKLVDIICYCLNLNHYHLLLKQLQDRGIAKFMHKIGMGYTNYFNIKFKHSGSIFQGPYKSIEINKTSYLLYLSAYINGNSEIHNISKVQYWPWSSYLDYVGERNGLMCNQEIILKEFRSRKCYEEFVNEVIRDSKKIKDEYRNLILE